MQRTYFVSALLIVLSSTIVTSQDGKAPVTIGAALNDYVKGAENDLVPAAEAMPEGKYAFAPTSGEFKGVRTFAEQLKHVAAVNYIIASGILGQKPPLDTGGEKGPDGVQSKADILRFLKDSFAYAHHAVLSIDQKNALEPVKSPFGGDTTRVAMATWISGHCFDHYGQVVEYLRMNGIIPPSSRQ
jgi:hypothetical protein